MNIVTLSKHLLLAICLLCSFKAISKDIVVGSKKFTENIILGELAKQIIEDDVGLSVTHKEELGGTRVLFEALKRGDIDIYPEYSGTLIFEILASQGKNSLEELKDHLRGLGLGITKPLAFNNTYALGMRREQAESLGIHKISQLSSHETLRYGLGHEFLDRQDGWPGLAKAYSLSHQNISGMDHDIAYKAIRTGRIDLMDLYSTDAEIQGYDLIALEDDKQYFPEYAALFLYRLDLEESVIASLKRFEGLIDANTMVGMNHLAKFEKQSPEMIAQNYLSQNLGVSGSEAVNETVLSDIVKRSTQHLYLVFVSLFAALVVSIPLGYLCFVWQKAGKIILGFVGVIQTIPSLAILVVMIPLFGIGELPAIIALFLYSLLPIVRGTHLGFSQIEPGLDFMIESMGLPKKSKIWRIRFPLALPAILNGLKTSAVINVGTATIGALIGAGGYGQTILKGIRLDDHQLILSGAIPAALMALGIQVAFDYLEKSLVSDGIRTK
ncbi:MAG: ABC transporter permease subunit [Pseudobacteriovorax sp.]|nr:ABC transporter permease subunit [Pseudobacteriovorax sp.]